MINIKAAKTNRINYIDVAKGFGMLMVVWGHIMLEGLSFVLVYAIDIPLFFFLAGMMFQNKKYSSLLQLLRARAKSLLLPYAIFSVTTWVIWVGYNFILGNAENYFDPLLQTVIAQGSGGYLVHNVPLWFVTCLFVTEIAYYFIAKTKAAVNIAICVLCAAIGCFMLNNDLAFDFTKLPWNIEAAMSALLFYSMGNLFKVHVGLNWLPAFTKNRKGASWICILILTVLLLIFAPVNGHVTLGSNSLGNSAVLFYVLGFFGIASTMLFSSSIEQARLSFISKITDFIRWIGKNSFYFMATHVPIKGVIIVVLSKIRKCPGTGITSNYLYSGITFVITMIICTVTVFLINKLLQLLSHFKMAQ